jgi:hypothetical protein
MAGLPPRWPPRAAGRGVAAGGVTIVELVIVAGITGLVVWGAATSIVSHIHTTSRQEAIQRLRDHWGRFNYFLDSEISEAEHAVTTAGCSTTTSGLVFSLQVPTAVAAWPIAQIDYYNKNGAVWRCGPPIDRNGRLVFTMAGGALQVVDNMLVDHATLSVDGTALAANPHEPIYTLSLTDPTGVTYAQTSSSRSRVRTFTLTQPTP